MQKNIAVIGYSQHAFVVCDCLISSHMNYKVSGYYEQEEKEENPYGLMFLGDENDDLQVHENGPAYFVAIGDNNTRRMVTRKVEERSRMSPVNAVHGSSILSDHVTLGSGIMIGPGVIVNSMSVIGSGTICNSGSIVEHGCSIGEYVHLCPGSVLCGQVSIGDATFIGANAVIKQGVTIGTNVTVGAGAVVIEDLSDGITVAGNPAKVI